MLPCDSPKPQPVCYYFSKWRDEEAFVHINDMPRETLSSKREKHPWRTAVIMDSQSVKTTRKLGLRGIDENKRHVSL